jgi:hypothetical protein
VGLVDESYDVPPGVENAFRLAELEDGGDDDLTDVLPEEPLEVRPGLRLDEVGDVGGVERRANLGVEVDAVHDD